MNTPTQHGRPATADGYRGERGAVTVWVILILGAGLSIFGGLIYDGGGVVTRRAEVTDAAWALSRAGAAQVAIVNGQDQVDPVRAKDEVAALAAAQWPEFSWDIDVGVDEVTVTVRGRYEAKLLGPFGWSGTSLEAVKTSEILR